MVLARLGWSAVLVLVVSPSPAQAPALTAEPPPPLRELHRLPWSEKGMPALPARLPDVMVAVAFVGDHGLVLQVGSHLLQARGPEWTWTPVDTPSPQVTLFGPGIEDTLILRVGTGLISMDPNGKVADLAIGGDPVVVVPSPWRADALCCGFRGRKLQTWLHSFATGAASKPLFADGTHPIAVAWRRDGSGFAAVVGEFAAGGGDVATAAAMCDEKGARTATFRTGEQVQALEFTPDGKSLFVAEGVLRRLAGDTAEEIARVERRFEAFGCVEERTGIGIDGASISVWDLGELREHSSFALAEQRPAEVKPGSRHHGAVLAVGWSADRRRVALVTFAGVRVIEFRRS